MDIYYRIGYAIFLMPCQIILTKVRPRWWLPSNEMAWGVMTGKSTSFKPRFKLLLTYVTAYPTALMAAAKDVRMMYALRFFIGVFEASSYPGIISILCNW